jgi:flagellar hook-associated protein 2
MAISSPGIGSGLDINSIVSQLVAVEKQPIKVLQSKVSTLQSKMSVFGQVKSDLSALQDAANSLMGAATWDSKTLTSGNTAAVTGTATSAALSSAFSVEVTSLASGQSVETSAVASTYVAPTTGTLSFRLGAWDANGNFSAAASSAVSVDVTAGDSLSTIAASINAKTSTAGVTATVVTTGSTQQLLIRGNTSGAQSGFQVTASTGLAPFGFTATPAVVNGSGTVTTPAVYSGMTRTQLAADAAITIDGIAVTSATNTVANAIPGVTLNLLAKTTTATSISVAADNTATKSKIQAFQDAYNKINADLKTFTAYNASTKTGGPLLGDGTASGLQGMLRTLVAANGPATSTIGRLSDLGIQVQRDGSLSTNSTKLDAALQDPKNVKEFFSASTGTASGNGIAKRIYDFAFGATGVGGSVTTHSAGFQKAIDQNNTAIDKFNAHISDYQKQLLARYTQLDTNMSKLNSLSSFVSSQITQWNKSG